MWTATVESIVEKLSRCKQTLERIKPDCARSKFETTPGTLGTAAIFADSSCR